MPATTGDGDFRRLLDVRPVGPTYAEVSRAARVAAAPWYRRGTTREQLVGIMGPFPADAGVTFSDGVVVDVAGKCLRVFGPSTCAVYDPSNRRPLNHRCETPRATPHICVCWECDA